MPKSHKKHNYHKGKETNKTNKTDNPEILAGEAIAAGGFGCVFKPALKCEGKTTRTPGISKMLIKRYAREEMEEIDKIKPIISKYFNK